MPVDLVPRPQLTDWLDERRHRRLTLISAPAGYGKSTLISSWLDTCKYPSAWLTLDEGDNDLAVFLTYFLEAICIIFPEAAKNSQALLTAHTQPPIKELVINLSNEINQLDQFFVLVLDDFEVIQENLVHDFLNELLLHPPQDFHLVLCTRIDPPLSIQKLRAQGQLTEIRAQDLRFSVEESYTFLQNMLGTTVDSTTARFMEEQAEGWVTGLRLAALALRHRVGKQRTEEKPTANNRYVSDYLMSEILDSQPTVFSEWLVKTSILARFNAGLCEVLCFGETELDGDVFLEWLVISNLFAIPLDDHNQWVRYHHLFREFLQTELVRRYNSIEVADLHTRASDWFAQNGLIEEALRHALASGDILAAAQLVEQNTRTVLDNDQWHILEKWMAQLPDNIIQERPELLIAKAWISFHQFALRAIP
ncbi:MAG: helix-turn-helix transcriptional regulator, partial [Chloroflexota bacterium]|nr:helix-turn-helix transcriptional regulator [Chloroflexota bacterium]